MQRISLSLGSLNADCPVVVIGSGYGGSVAASRLARAGQPVVVLERGREWLPGEFPDTEAEILDQMQFNVDGEHVGRRDGLYEYYFDDDISVFKGCGLGGGSLVNANVALDAEPAVFQRPCWPSGLAGDPGQLLERGYAHARAMLKPAPYPDDQPRLAKLEAHRRSAAHLGEPFVVLPINVNFAPGVNHVGVQQEACCLCGDCVTGCNHSAKNTLPMNYLADAWNHGARIFTGADVRWLERAAGRWRIHYRPTNDLRQRFADAPDLVVTAELVILGAGALGSSEILLRSREHGLALSPRLGELFTGNGDLLGFGYNNDIPIHGVGFGQHQPAGRTPVGPCITSAIDARHKAPLEDGLLIEEGSVPGGVANLLPLKLALDAKLYGRDTDTGIADFVKEATRELDSVVRGAYHGAVRNTQTYLVMAHDDGKGRLLLENDHLRLRWPGVRQQDAFRRGNAKLVECTAANGGTAVPNPQWSPRLKESLITVHPLGGCAMGEDASLGVTNHRGEVFRGATGDAVYDDLLVLDGAVIPTPLGVNPLLTITALAERNIGLLAEQHAWRIDYALPSRPTRQGRAQRVGVRFTESMRGWFSSAVAGMEPAEPALYEQGAAQGEVEGSSLRFILTLAAEDLNAMLADERHRMSMSGSVEAPVLSSSPLAVEQGYFELLPDNPDQAGTKNMVYDMQLAAADGSCYHLHGYKVVRDDPGVDIWPDTTTLYTTLRLEDARGPVLGRGLLRISPADFARQLTTTEITGASGLVQRLEAQVHFGRFFAGKLYEVYGGVLAGPHHFDPAAPPRKRRPLRTSAPEVHPFRTSDGALLRLTHYAGGTKGPVLLCHGLGMSSRIFSLDTIDTNLVEYLFAHGYDVWLLDFRVSSELESSRAQCNGDQIASIDFPEAVQRVSALTGAANLQMIVHCYGANVFFMSMLAGMEGVRSAVVSQVGAHLDAAPLTRVKAGLFLPQLLAQLGVSSLTAYTDQHADWLDRLFEKAIALAPSEREERCTSPVCQRATLLYSLLYEHDQLNPATHSTLHELFGAANVATFEHLSRMLRAGKLVNAAGQDVYLGHPERLALPICFIHGAENACYLPSSTEKTYSWLCASNGPRLYQRHVVPDFGHLDCILGMRAARVTYPLMLAHLEQTARV